MYARRIKSLYEKMQQDLEDQKKRMTRLVIGITHTAESNIIDQVLAIYCSLNEDVSIKIITDSIKNLHNMLSNYEIDLAIVEGSIKNSNISSLILDTDYLVLVCSNDHPWAKKSMVKIEDIKKERMILRLPDSGTRNLFVVHLESVNMSIDELNLILEVDNIGTIKDLVERKLGVSILARRACLDDARKGRLTILPIENLSMTRETSTLYHKDFNHKNILKLLLRFIMKLQKYTGNHN